MISDPSRQAINVLKREYEKTTATCEKNKCKTQSISPQSIHPSLNNVTETKYAESMRHFIKHH